MAVITGIVPSAEQPGHVIIMVDGAPFATVPAAAVERLSLGEGAPVEAASVLGPMDSAMQKTYERALNMLSYRGRSVEELRRRLIDKGETPTRVDAVLVRLCANGLLDDASFAEARARAGLVGKGRSQRRIQDDLARRGVAPEVARAAIARVLADEQTNEGALAERAARKKLSLLSHLPSLERRRKVYAYLVRQGYTPDAIRRAMNAVLGTSSPEEPDE